MFTDQQKVALAAFLKSDVIKTRSQSGRNLSYLEGWHCIAEANRIFGFDGWTRETVELKCVAEAERKVGSQQTPGWGVTYLARVRITVSDIVREGAGTGHGIDRDLGQAHESALKEAETDAMKRALMTFGNQFGLALYDKEQSEVERPRQTATTEGSWTITNTPKPQQIYADEKPSGDKSKAVAWTEKMLPMIRNMSNDKLSEWSDKFADDIARMRMFAPDSHAKIIAAIKDRFEVLGQAA